MRGRAVLRSTPDSHKRAAQLDLRAAATRAFKRLARAIERIKVKKRQDENPAQLLRN